MIYARPLAMFEQKVDHEKYPDANQEYRFELLKNGKDRDSEIKDILGDNYDLDRLRELVQEDRTGRCKTLEKMVLEYQETIVPGYRKLAEKAIEERDAAVSDLETVMAYGGANVDTCQFCKNSQCYARGGTKLCLPKWRGKKE